MTAQIAWGILSTGRIAGTFAKALTTSKTGRLLAVASRNQESADRFGDEHNVPRRYPNYEALLADPEVDAVYIATLHPYHTEWAIKAAEAGKHVLCEKPLTINYPQAMAVIEAAKRCDVFLMEAFMYRCHPQTAKLVELIRDGAIGDVRVIQASFSFSGDHKLDSRILDPSQAGGGILDVGCYCTSMARLIAGVANGLPFCEPLELQALGHLGPQSHVDEYAVAIASFPGDILAQLSTGVRVSQDNRVRVYGTRGSITVPSPWLCQPTDGAIKIILERAGEAMQEIVIETDRSVYAYEADAVAAAIANRQATPPAMTWDDTLGNIKTLDRWRQAIGLSYPSELQGAAIPPAAGSLRRIEARPEMKFANIKAVSKPISRFVMGTMIEGTAMPLAQGFALFDDFFERGGNCFDTAYVYRFGEAERTFGEWVKQRGVRDEIVVLGKGAHTPHNNPEALTRELHESLVRMQLQSVDLYMMHRDNPDIPVGEYIDVLNEHLNAGRMCAFGGSNWSLPRVKAANEYAQRKGLIGFSTVSNNFSLARMVDPIWADSLSSSDAAWRQWFTDTQSSLFAWSSQARGFFARADRANTSDAELVRCWYSDDNFQRLERARELAARRGVSPTTIAAAYVLCQPYPTYALIGPQALSETRTTLEALDVALEPAELRWLNLED